MSGVDVAGLLGAGSVVVASLCSKLGGEGGTLTSGVEEASSVVVVASSIITGCSGGGAMSPGTCTLSGAKGILSVLISFFAGVATSPLCEAGRIFFGSSAGTSSGTNFVGSSTATACTSVVELVPVSVRVVLAMSFKVLVLTSTSAAGRVEVAMTVSNAGVVSPVSIYAGVLEAASGVVVASAANETSGNETANRPAAIPLRAEVPRETFITGSIAMERGLTASFHNLY